MGKVFSVEMKNVTLLPLKMKALGEAVYSFWTL